MLLTPCKKATNRITKPCKYYSKKKINDTKMGSVKSIFVYRDDEIVHLPVLMVLMLLYLADIICAPEDAGNEVVCK